MDIDVEKAILMGRRFREFEFLGRGYRLNRPFRDNFTKPSIEIKPNGYITVYPNLSPDHKKYEQSFIWFLVGYNEPPVFEDKVVDSSIFDPRKSERYA